MKKLLLIILIMLSSRCFAIDNNIVFVNHFDGLVSNQDFTCDYMPFYTFYATQNANNAGIPRLDGAGKWGQSYNAGQSSRYSYCYNYTDFNVNTVLENDFTIDFWLYLTSADAGIDTGYVLRAGSFSTYVLMQDYTVKMSFTDGSGSGYVNYQVDDFIHYAFVRSGNTLKAYRNGILQATSATTAPALNISNIRLGREFISGDAFTNVNFLMDELRVSRKAEWLENFTPPAAPYSYAPIYANIRLGTSGEIKLGSDGLIKLDWRQ